MILRCKKNHPFHLVNSSPWPFLLSISILGFICGLIMFLHNIADGLFLLFLGFSNLSIVICRWFGDIIREGTFEGHHTKAVQLNLKLGGLLFILTEAMLFFSFFWAYLHVSLVPSPAIGGVWPPKFIITINPWELPLLNTFLLLSSGATLTWAHAALIKGNKLEVIYALLFTIKLSIFFTGTQISEYLNAHFNISDSIYGSSFYLITGFHGFHVIIGTIFLLISLIRTHYNHFSKEQHIGFEIGAWYWHFVDVIWIFVFFLIYVWGN